MSPRVVRGGLPARANRLPGVRRLVGAGSAACAGARHQPRGTRIGRVPVDARSRDREWRAHRRRRLPDPEASARATRRGPRVHLSVIVRARRCSRESSTCATGPAQCHQPPCRLGEGPSATRRRGQVFTSPPTARRWPRSPSLVGCRFPFLVPFLVPLSPPPPRTRPLSPPPPRNRHPCPLRSCRATALVWTPGGRGGDEGPTRWTGGTGDRVRPARPARPARSARPARAGSTA